MKEVGVKTGRPYRVYIGDFLEEGNFLSLKEADTFLLTDENVYEIYKDHPLMGLDHRGVFVVEAGEGSKSISTYERVLEAMAELNLDRKSILVAFGGGVVGDLGGFAAASFLRGIDFVQVPTTILAAVDSSVGGKTALNLSSGKNMVGAFHQPQAVYINPDFFKTLEAKEFASGLSEVIKTAILFDSQLFTSLEKGLDQEDLSKLVASCVGHKSRIVEEDEREAGVRRLLNLGHTIGHAIERLENYQLSHGAAVAIGMAITARASAAAGDCDLELGQRIQDLLLAYDLPIVTDLDFEEIFQVAKGDKKANPQGIVEILISDLGQCQPVQMSWDQWKDYFSDGY